MTTFSQPSGTSNPFDGLSVGSFSAPVFVDIDGDGDSDLLVATVSGLTYFENTGSATAPAYQAISQTASPISGLDVGASAKLAFADIDGDNDFDAVVGGSSGTLAYYENVGDANTPTFALQSGTANPFSAVNVGSSSTPTFADIDGDGDLDAVVGSAEGTLSYFENTGSTTAPTYVERTGSANPFDTVGAGIYITAPTFADIDSDGDLDLVLGTGFSGLQYYENVGSAANPVYSLQTGTANPFNAIVVGEAAFPAVADVDGDTDIDVVVGGVNAGAIRYLDNLLISPNVPPTGSPTGIVANTVEDTPLVIDLATLTQGFTDANGDDLFVVGITASTGTVTANQDGTFTYTPVLNFSGGVTLTYTITDNNGGLVEGVTRSFVVTADNDAPTVAVSPADQVAFANQGFSYALPGGTFSDVDAGDSLSLSATLANGDPLPSWLTFDGTSFSGTPTAQDAATLLIEVTATDLAGAEASTTFELTIFPPNDPPTGSPTGTVPDTAEDTPLVISVGILTDGFTDPEGAPLTVLDVTASSGSIANNNDGTYTYTPAADFSGSVTLTYTVTDGTGGVVENVTRSFTVTADNDSPVGPPSATLLDGVEDTPTTIAAADLLVGISDPEGDSFAITALSADVGTVVDNQDGTYAYTPEANYNGVVTLTYTVTDSNGGAADFTQTFSLQPTNDAPEFAEDTVAVDVPTNVGSEIVYTATALDPDEGDALFYGIVNGNDLGIFAIDPQTGALTIADSTALSQAVDSSVTLLIAVSDDVATDTLSLTLNITPGLGANITDLNGDGLGDIVWRNGSTGANYVWYFDDAGGVIGFDEIASLPSAAWQITGIGDLDQDGSADDLLWYNTTSGSIYAWTTDSTDNGLAVVNAYSLGTLSPSAGWTLTDVGDMDGDSYRDDLVWFNSSSGTVAVWFTEGDSVTGFESLSAGTAGTGWEVVALGDFDGDTLQDDLVWRNSFTGENGVWLMDGVTPTGFVSVDTVSDLTWEIAGVSDFEGTGTANDILWRNTVSGSTGVWLLDESSVAVGYVDVGTVGTAWEAVV